MASEENNWLTLDLYLKSDLPENKPFTSAKRLSRDERRRYCELHNIKLIDPFAIVRARRTPAEEEAVRIFNQNMALKIQAAEKRKAQAAGKQPLVQRPLAAAGTKAEMAAGSLPKRPRGNSAGTSPKPEQADPSPA